MSQVCKVKNKLSPLPSNEYVLSQLFPFFFSARVMEMSSKAMYSPVHTLNFIYLFISHRNVLKISMTIISYVAHLNAESTVNIDFSLSSLTHYQCMYHTNPYLRSRNLAPHKI